MSWAIQARGTHRHGSHVKFRWLALTSVHDVWVECPDGVHGSSSTDLFRDEMNAFTDPIDVYFQWGDGEERPHVDLYWTDEGEQCQQKVFLSSQARHRPLRTLTRRLLHPAGPRGRTPQGADS